MSHIELFEVYSASIAIFVCAPPMAPMAHNRHTGSDPPSWLPAADPALRDQHPEERLPQEDRAPVPADYSREFICAAQYTRSPSLLSQAEGRLQIAHQKAPSSALFCFAAGKPFIILI